MGRSALLGSLLLAAACSSHEYVYEPAANATAQIAGVPAADYPIPPEQPRGDVRLATFGFADIAPKDDPDARTASLHVRMIVADNAAQPWTVDTREQRVSLASFGESRPAYAAADTGGSPPPLVQIPPGGRRTIDLFFPLPERYQDADKLPEFDAVWTVATDARPVTERTPFERITIEPRVYATYDWGAGWGPPYWYDPWYPNGAFGGVILEPRFRVGGPHDVDIHPRGGYHGPPGGAFRGAPGGGFRGGGARGGGRR